MRKNKESEKNKTLESQIIEATVRHDQEILKAQRNSELKYVAINRNSKKENPTQI